MDEDHVGSIKITKYPVLQLVTGGKTTIPPRVGYDWMSELKMGCVFVVKDKAVSNIDCFQYYMEFTGSETIRVIVREDGVRRTVDVKEFCKVNELMDVLKESGDDG